MSCVIATPKAELKITVVKDGKVLKEHKQPANSWLKNFYAWFTMVMKLGSSQDVTDENGNSFKIAGALGNTYIWDYESSTRTRLAIGTSDQAFDVNQYSLGNKYAEANVSYVAYDAENRKITVRTSISVSSTIYVRETGIKFYNVKGTDATLYPLFIERTVLSEPVEVPSGASVIVEYTLQA